MTSPSKEVFVLYVAIIDGSDPKTWTAFNRKFVDVLSGALSQTAPLGVPPRLMDRYDIHLRPLWTGPDDLLQLDYLSKVVGVVIDGDPKLNAKDGFGKKLRVLKDLCARQKSADALFRKFGYRVWFVTPDSKSAEFSEFHESVRDALEARGVDAAGVRYPIVSREDLLAPVLSEYLSDAYYSLDRGRL